MKKLLITLLILSANNLALLAQKDSIVTNFFEKGTKWVQLSLTFNYEEQAEMYGCKGRVATIDVYEIIGDTTIDNRTHWKVTCKGYPNHNLNICYNTADPYAYVGIENGTVWHSLYERTTYRELYHLGETFETGRTLQYWGAKLDGSMTEETIQRIDTITFCNGYRAIVANDKFIYGLGHKSHPLYWAYEDWNPIDESYHSCGRFLCFYYRGEIILQDDELMDIMTKSVDLTTTNLPLVRQETTPPDNLPIYDLTGRRLYKLPEKGIYIQGGKKRVVK